MRGVSACDWSAESESLEQAVEHHAVVHVDGEIREADGPQQIVDHQRRFDIGHDTRGADRVEIALHELAVPAALRVLAAPDGGDVVALERGAQFTRMLCGEPGQRHRQVETQADLAAAVVLKLVQLAIGLFAPLAGEDLQVLKRRRVDGTETVRAIDALGRLDQLARAASSCPASSRESP